jgi:hypothetical protein
LELEFVAVIRTIRDILLPAGFLSAGANPSFIANQMGHENAQMVYEIYATWIEEMNGEQVDMLNSKLAV